MTRNGVRIPLQGGEGDPNGEFNAIYSKFTPGKGFADVNDGSSYVQVVTWNDGACPDAATILTYSESDNPTSPFYADQTALFSRKQWVPERFCENAVLAGTRSTTVLEPGSTQSTPVRHPRKRRRHRAARRRRKRAHAADP